MAENQWGNWGLVIPGPPNQQSSAKFAHLAIFLSRSHWMHSALIAAAFVLLRGKPVGKTSSSFWLHKNPQISPDQDGRGKGFGFFLFRRENRSFEEWMIFSTHFLIFFRWWILVNPPLTYTPKNSRPYDQGLWKPTSFPYRPLNSYFSGGYVRGGWLTIAIIGGFKICFFDENSLHPPKKIHLFLEVFSLTSTIWTKKKELGGLVSLSIHRFASIRNLREPVYFFLEVTPGPPLIGRFIKIKGGVFFKEHPNHQPPKNYELHPWKLTCPFFKGTISIGNTSEPTIDFQGITVSFFFGGV